MGVPCCCRQVFLEMISLAAVCSDAAAAAGYMFKQDVRTRRADAAAKVAEDIKNLLRWTTPYYLADTYGELLGRLVYMHRALTTTSGQA